MDELFLGIVNMSIAAGWCVLAVLAIRLLLKRAPKWISVLLWAIVGLRLACPFAPESLFSLIPSSQTVPPVIMSDRTPVINTGLPAINNAVNPIITQSFSPAPEASANPLQILVPMLSVVWIAGIAIMLAYALISLIRLKKRVATAVRICDNIYQSEAVGTPFVLGLIKPRIYLRFGIDERDAAQVIAHERAHIRRRDHLWKPIGYLLLCLHWFNPLIWVAYLLLCRDIELACDERVVMEMDPDAKADYSQALLRCSVDRRMISACPLAFGESDVGLRIKKVLNYKRPAFWMILAAIAVSVAAALCLLTDPAPARLGGIEGNDLWSMNGEDLRVIIPADGGYRITDPAERELIDELFEIKISKREISLDRGEEREKSHTLILNTDHHLSAQTVSSALDGVYLHFDADFGSVWLNDGVKPTLSYAVLEPEAARDIYFRLTNEGGGLAVIGGADPAPTVIGRRLTLDDVLRLSGQGEELGWEDFAEYSHVETGSGLYIRLYEIDELFSVLVGGTSPLEQPWYIYLHASDALDESIDIRTGDVEAFIAAHRNNPVTEGVAVGVSFCAVDHTGDNFEKMVELGGPPPNAYMSSIRSLPCVRVTSRAELDAFKGEMDGLMDFGLSFIDIPSFDEAAKAYTDEFFENNTLLLLYTPSGSSANRFLLEGATLTRSLDTLSVGIIENAGAAGDSVMTGWLICLALSNADAADAEIVDARVTSLVMPEDEGANPIAEYTLKGSHGVIDPSFTLFDNRRFSFVFSPYSSYHGIGDYSYGGGGLILTTDDGRYRLCFNEVGDEMIFDAAASSALPPNSAFTDQSVFEK